MAADGGTGTFDDLFHALFHLASERIGVAIEIDCFSSGFADEAGDDFVSRPVADDESSAFSVKIFVERLEAAAEKFLSWSAAPAMLLPPWINYVERDDLIVSRNCGIERGIVGESKIAAKPMNGEGHEFVHQQNERASQVVAAFDPMLEDSEKGDDDAGVEATIPAAPQAPNCEVRPGTDATTLASSSNHQSLSPQAKEPHGARWLEGVGAQTSRNWYPGGEVR
jgi:hypothetical protein